MDVSSSQMATDAVAIASQLGRLDVVSAILGALSVVIILSALPMFLFLRYHAGRVAKDAADEFLKGSIAKLEETANKRLQEMLPKMVEDYVELARNNAVSTEQADEIAAAQETNE